MSQYAQQNHGAPTFTAASASLSLSGLDHNGYSPALDPTLLDNQDWYPNPGHAPPPLSPQHEQYPVEFGTGFSSHRVAVSHEPLHRKSARAASSLSASTVSLVLFSAQFLAPCRHSSRRYLSCAPRFFSWPPCTFSSGSLCIRCRHLASLHAIARDFALRPPPLSIFGTPPKADTPHGSSILPSRLSLRHPPRAPTPRNASFSPDTSSMQLR